MNNYNEILKNYENYLKKEEMSDNTIKAYLWTASFFLDHYNTINKSSVLKYKTYLIEHYKPKTVNSRIYAINRFLLYLNKNNLSLKTIKIQQRTFLDNVISNAEYQRFLKKLKENNNIKYYMIVRTLACTGARVSELIQFQIEDIREGYIDIYAKGGKLRRIYFPKALQDELLSWTLSEHRETGKLFLNKNGVTISIKGIEHMLKCYAAKYNINPAVVHPHSFRHRYALNFLRNKPKELVALADILGHSCLDTTRIYTRRTAREQYELVNSTVNW